MIAAKQIAPSRALTHITASRSSPAPPVSSGPVPVDELELSEPTPSRFKTFATGVLETTVISAAAMAIGAFVAGPVLAAVGAGMGMLAGTGSALKSLTAEESRLSLNFKMGQREMAIGARPVARGPGAIAIGLAPVAEGRQAKSFGVSPTARGDSSMAVGMFNSEAEGAQCRSHGMYLSTSVGQGAQSKGLVANLAYGDDSQAVGLVGSLAFGERASARGFYFTYAQGPEADARGVGSTVAVGPEARARGPAFRRELEGPPTTKS